MTIKIYLNNQTLKFPRLPESLESFLAQITSTFKNDLPNSWKVQYLAPNGDQFVLSKEDDFQKLLETEASSPNLTLKFDVLPNENSNASNLQNQIPRYSSLEENKVIPVLPSVQQSELSSQNQLEKIVVAESKVDINIKQKIIEAESQQKIPQLKNKDRNKNKIQLGKARKLIRELVKGKHPEEVINQMTEELNAIRSTLSVEQNKQFDKRRGKIEERLKNKIIKEKKPRQLKDGLIERRAKRQGDNKKIIFKLVNFVKILKRIVKIQSKGETEKTNKCKEKLRKMTPENGNFILKSILTSLPCNFDAESSKETIFSGTRKLIEECFPETKEQILEELEKIQGGLFKEKKDKKGNNSADDRKKEKAELREKYSNEIIKKTAILKRVFPREDVPKICEYVRQNPEESGLEELVKNFRK